MFECYDPFTKALENFPELYRRYKERKIQEKLLPVGSTIKDETGDCISIVLNNLKKYDSKLQKYIIANAILEDNMIFRIIKKFNNFIQ